jgi:hypothetical protein
LKRFLEDIELNHRVSQERKKEMKHRSGKVRVRGFILPTQWDKDGNIIEISLYTQERPYVILWNKQGERLLRLIGVDVEITGFITGDDEGTKLISVTSYKIKRHPPILNENDYSSPLFSKCFKDEKNISLPYE